MRFLLLFVTLTLLPLQAADSAGVTLHPSGQLTTQLEEAVASVNSGKVTAITFGPGDFEIDQALEFKLPFGHPGLRIQGSGPGITRLIFKKANGIQASLETGLTARQRNPSILIENLSLVANGKCAAAISLKPGDSEHRGGVASKTIRNITIEGQQGSWTTGIVVDDLTFCTFRDLILRLPGKSSTGIHLTGKSAPVDHHFDGIRILGGATGIRVTGTVEGVYLHQITMINTDIGIDWDTTGPEPLLSLSGSHINARSCCLSANKLLQPIIIGNLFYQANPELPWTGIRFSTEKPTAYDLFQISNNTFHGHPRHSEPNTGLFISAASAAVLQGNLFSHTDTGIDLGKHASHLKPTASVFKNTATSISR